MSQRPVSGQSHHDDAVLAAGEIYRDHGKHAWVNPNGEKNKSWSGRYIDVIAVQNTSADKAWVIEIETDDSVADSEAKDQWKDYADAYSRWYLAVPLTSEDQARRLLSKHDISNCSLITWRRNPNGIHTFWNLPGL
ncbi:MAG: hypothetical protein CVU57_23460 [Deltaproteobacteria bacterium HGW-Deltaproteobacteria-15]|jgi:hypothetical protein|nr:MAG: hypothetical protein CVU57_23460 [Deltaproteobacteria bacterium HGW-Deltaproteobacteria-15]